MGEMESAQGGPVLMSSDTAGELKTPFGFSLKPVDATDAQTMSDRYGDVISEVFGAGNLVRDAVNSVPAFKNPYRGPGRVMK